VSEKARKPRKPQSDEVASLRRQVAALEHQLAAGRAPLPMGPEDAALLFGNVQDPLLVARAGDGCILFVNAACQDLMGIPATQLLGASLFDMAGPKHRQAMKDEIEEAVGGNHLLRNHDIRYPRRDGRTMDIRIGGVIVQSAGQGLILVYMQDLSAAVEVRRRLRDAEERYKQVVELAADPIFMFDRSMRFVTANAAAAKSMHCRPEDLIGKVMADIFPPQIAERQTLALQRLIETGEPIISEENESYTPDGPRWFNTSLTPIKDEQGQVQYVIGIARDVTARKLTEEALRDSRARLQAIYNALADGVMIVDAETLAVLSVNSGASRLTGYSEAEILEMTAPQFRPPSSPSRIHQMSEGLQPGQSNPGSDVDMRRKDGSVFYADVSVTVLMYQGRRAIQAVFRDVTDRKKVAEALRDREQELRTVFGTMPNGLLVIDLEDGRFVATNPAMCRMLGMTEAEVLTRTVRDLPPSPGYEAMIEANNQRLLRGETIHLVDIEIARQDGSTFRAEVSNTPIMFRGRPCCLSVINDTTERHLAQEALREKQSELQTILDTMNRGVMITDLETGRIVTVNPTGCGMFGYTEAEMLALSARDLHPPQELVRFRAGFERVRRGDPHTVEDAWCLRKDGSVFPASLSVAPMVHRGRPSSLAIIRDVTERHRAEEALRESEEKHRTLIETTDTGYVIVDDHGRVLDANEEYVRLTGHQKLREILGRVVTEWTAEYDLNRNADEVRRCLERGFVRNLNVDYVDRQGRITPVEMNATVLKTAEGARIVTLCRDITDRKRAEEALRQSEENYRILFEQNQEGVVVLVDGHFVGANPAFARIHGTTLDEVVGKPANHFIHPAEKSTAMERQASILRGEELSAGRQYRAVRADGSEIWIEVHATRIHWGGRLAVQVLVRDVTQSKAAQEALQRSEENYRVLFEGNLDGVIVMAGGRIVSANSAFADIFRTTVPKVLGTIGIEWIHPDDRARGLDRHARIMEGREPVEGTSPYRALRADGTEAWVEARGKRITWEGQPALQVIFRDMTQRLRLEEELRQAQKLEALGQMAGGIAHDFNNLITGILCHAGLLKGDPRAGAEAHETATIIEKAARRAADLTGQLLGFAQRGKHQDIPVDIHAVIETVTALVTGTTAPRIAIRKDLSPAPLWARGDPGQMEQAILNLALNARDAMADGGDMTFAAFAVTLDEAACAGRPGARPGAFVAISVRDTGAGMSPEVRAHIFEPFFTTKPRGKGIGMGLAMVYGIVTNHGGWVEVESAPGRGSTFTVFLPAAPTPETPPEEPISARASARILLVDDEEVVRNVATRMLTNMGHKVVAVANGAEALESYRAFGSQWDLVIIDMVMPGMDGRECLKALRAINPQVRAILCTGGGADRATCSALKEGAAGFIQKPYEPESLAEVIQKVLSQPSGRE
jgi:two-component system, cell cycle sensor histidine kinase and response regulator CckA